MQLPIQAIDPSPVAMHQIRHRQVRPTANNNDDAGGGVGQPAAARSALPVPDDPLDGIMQFLGTENGFAVDTNGCAGAWFDDFRDGDMEMLLDLPDTIVLTAEATETATRAEAAAVPDRLAVMNLSSLSSGDDMDEDEGDDAHWLSSSDSSSDDEAADAHWLPSKPKKRGCRKRRLQHQQSTPAGQRKQQMGTVVRPAPHGVVVAVEGGGGGNDRWCRHCGTVETPLWRAGPEGPKTLCNACGLRYKNKLAPLTAKRRQAAAAKPSGAKSKSHSVLPLVGDATVMRKKRSLLIRID